MMGSGGGNGQDIGAVEGLLALVADPKAFAAKLQEYKNAQAVHDKARDDAFAAMEALKGLQDTMTQTRADLNKEQEDLDKALGQLARRICDLDAREAELHNKSVSLNSQDQQLVQRKVQLDQQQADLDTSKARFADELKAKRVATEKDLVDLTSRQKKQTDDAKAALDARADQLDARESVLNDREKALKAKEAQAAKMQADYQARVASLNSLLKEI